MLEAVTNADFAVLDLIQKLHSKALDFIMQAITVSGDNGYIWIAVCIVLICIPKTRKIGIFTAVTLIVEVILNDGIVKGIIARERPFIQNSAIDTIIRQPSGYSFPSGHSASSFAAATAIFMHNKRLGIPAYVLAALIAFSRLYFYVHFPSDVIIGSLFGMLIGFCVNKLLKLILEKIKNRKDSDKSPE
ncbi:phosphatase PAP2 family protein [Ruminococcus sp. Marseille-P6503]|uniref:phosphatase PAP2 family protein n=1 Tax=Ruminococcus sp. Marseille-P6503 TaxID=2364796 RepID=UPI000F536C7C|nr:phosphatase PAP2 family protein [Ruminococcus sp. Marseille-P6503]